MSIQPERPDEALDDVSVAFDAYQRAAVEWRTMVITIARLESPDRLNAATIDLVTAQAYRVHALPRLASIARFHRSEFIKIMSLHGAA